MIQHLNKKNNKINKLCKGVKNICPFNCTSERNLNNYCKNCFFYLFPDNELVKNMLIKIKEIEMVNFICYDNNSTNQLKWVFNRQIETNNECASKKRVDVRLHRNTTMLCIESDEGQHLKYADECIRYNDIISAHTEYKYIFIRYNPDSYKINNISIDPDKKIRYAKLAEMINKQIERIDRNENNEILEIYYLFYDDDYQSKTDTEKDLMIEMLLKSMAVMKKDINKMKKLENKIKIDDAIPSVNVSKNIQQTISSDVANADNITDIYTCNKCDREFKYKSEYERHLDKKVPCNNDEKINFFKQKKMCSYCNKEFTRIDAVARHTFTCPNKLKHDASIKETDNVQTDKLLKEIQNMKNRISYLEKKTK